MKIVIVSIILCLTAPSQVYSKCVHSYASNDFHTREVKCIDSALDEINNKSFTAATKLTVADVKLEKLPNEAFRFPRLTGLTVTGCEFDYIHRNAFSNLRHLAELTVEHSTLHNVNLNSFHDQKSLRSLSLRNDSIRLLYPDMLENTRRLKVFDASFNRLELVDFHMFRFTPRLESLNLTSNSISHLIGPETESYLEILILRANRLTGISAASFGYFKLLKELDLSVNEIENVDRDSFRNNRRLQSLDLSENRVSVLPPALFDGLGLLKRLDLSENQILSLSPDVFGHLASLERLDVSGNCIKDFGIDRLAGIRALKALRSRYLPTNDTDVLADLRELRLDNWFVCDSYREVYTGDVFRYPRLLDVAIDRKTVYLTHENFEYIPVVRLELRRCKLTELPPYTFGAMYELEHLDLSHNDVGRLAVDQFKSQTNLERLILTECGLDTLDPAVLRPLKSLKYLNLDGNKLAVLPANAFRSPYLDRVSIRHNVLTDLPKDLLNRGTYVEYLDVSNNRLSNFRPGTFNNTFLVEFKYDGNPIHCECLDVIERELSDALITSNGFKNGRNCVDVHNSRCSALQAMLHSDTVRPTVSFRSIAFVLVSISFLKRSSDVL